MQRRWQNANTVQSTGRQGHGTERGVYKEQPQAGHTQRLTGQCEGGGSAMGARSACEWDIPFQSNDILTFLCPPSLLSPAACCLLLCWTLSLASVGVNKCSQSASFKCCLFTFNFGQHKYLHTQRRRERKRERDSEECTAECVRGNFISYFNLETSLQSCHQLQHAKVCYKMPSSEIVWGAAK